MQIIGYVATILHTLCIHIEIKRRRRKPTTELWLNQNVKNRSLYYMYWVVIISFNPVCCHLAFVCIRMSLPLLLFNTPAILRPPPLPQPSFHPFQPLSMFMEAYDYPGSCHASLNTVMKSRERECVCVWGGGGGGGRRRKNASFILEHHLSYLDPQKTRNKTKNKTTTTQTNNKQPTEGNL